MKSRTSQLAALMLLASLFLGACAPARPGGGSYPRGNPYGSYPYGAAAGYGASTAASLPPAAASSPRSDPLALTSGLKFRDEWLLEWGQDKDKFESRFPNAGIRCDNTNLRAGEQACVVPALILPLKVTAKDAFANFYHGKLFCVWLFYDPSELADLRDIIEQSFGEPEAATPSVERWSSEMVIVDLLIPQAGDLTGTLVVTYKPLMKVMLADMHPPASGSSSQKPVR